MLPSRLNPTLRVGTPVKFATSHDVFPILVIEAGTAGVISEIDTRHDQVTIWVYLGEGTSEDLEEWHNRVELTTNSFDTEIEFFEHVNALLVPTGPADVKDFAGQLAREALNMAAKHIQDVLGVESGDLAGVFFSDDACEELLTNYAATEMEMSE